MCFQLSFWKEDRDARAYFHTLRDSLLPFFADNFGESTFWHFQQDGASIDRAQFTMNWVRETGVSKI